MHDTETRFFLHYEDMTDATNLIRLLQETQPHEIYNLAAQSHVQVSFETPEYTANADALGTLRLGVGEQEVGVDTKTGKELVRVDSRYFRPTEVDDLRGDASRAHRK
jgi:GDPmannose 4,6-dehydratase